MSGARVGITQRVEVLADLGERRDVLDQAWAPWIAAGGDLAVPIPNAVDDVVGFVSELALTAIVLTGGNDLAHLAGAANPAPERDAVETQLLTHATENEIPVLAVCRGMQMLVHFWGGTPSRVEGHTACTHAIERVFSPWPLRTGPVNSFHDWGVRSESVGATLEVLAQAPDGTVEAVAHRTLPQVGIMWHPERAEPDPTDRKLLWALIASRR